MSVTREEVKEWLRDWERDYVSLSEGPDAGHWDQRLACARAALAALDDAERWQFVRKFFDVDGEAEGELGAHYEHVTVDEDALFKATVANGLGKSVESLVDASRAGGA